MKRPVRKEKPFPVAGAVVAIACLGVVGVVWIFLKPSRRTVRTAEEGRRRRRPRRTASEGRREPGSTATATGPEPGRPAALTPKLVNFSPVARSDRFKDWKLAARCPKCRQEVATWMSQTCSCGQPLRWPGEISCPFCDGGGKCRVCKGEETVCKYCKGIARRSMMGIEIEKCGYCDGSGKCAACKGEGDGKCPMCEGTGKIVPAKMSR